jgi:hypothetical protein
VVILVTLLITLGIQGVSGAFDNIIFGIMPVRNPQDALTRFGKISRYALPSGVDADAGAMV